MAVKVSAIDHIVINVADVARSAQWYEKILGMEIRVFDPGPGKPPRTSLMLLAMTVAKDYVPSAYDEISIRLPSGSLQ